MKKLINRYGTPFTTALFLISTISGVALFFHVGQAYFRLMHEWLSMVLILPFVLHVWKNWFNIVGYFRKGWLMWPMAVCTVAAVAFAWPALTGQTRPGRPPAEAFTLMSKAPLSDLAPIVGGKPDDLATKLRAKNFRVASTTQSLDAIAKASGKTSIEAMNALVKKD